MAPAATTKRGLITPGSGEHCHYASMIACLFAQLPFYITIGYSLPSYRHALMHSFEAHGHSHVRMEYFHQARGTLT